MPYQTGAVASFAALKTEIMSFLVANSWTQESDIIKRDGVFGKITTGTDSQGYAYIQLEGGKGSDGAGNLVDKHDGPVPFSQNAGRMDDGVGLEAPGAMVFPINYYFHLFESPVVEFWCIIQFNGDRSQHMGFGNIVKAAPFTGGGFYSSSVSSTLNIFNFDNFNSVNFLEIGLSNSKVAMELLPFNVGRAHNFPVNQFSGSVVHAEIGGLEWYMSGKIESFYPGDSTMLEGRMMFEERVVSEASVNNVPNLVPIRLFGRAASGNLQRIGHLENLKFAQIGSMNFGQVESDGVDSWKFYPAYLKNTLEPEGGQNHTGTAGIAIRYDGP